MFLDSKEVAIAIGSNTIPYEGYFSGISTDSRSTEPGDLFIALRGERFDGHDYVKQAISRGADAVVVEHIVDGVADGYFMLVPDTLIAYGELASAWRSRFSVPVVGVTGSVGKTTMKEMCALALSPLGPVLKSEKNENNEIGVPQTLLRLAREHKAAVIEMGMRGFGQIAYLSEIANPTIGVVTLIGESHIEMVGSRFGIADAKGELLDSLSADNVAVLNGDDSFYSYLASKTCAAIVSYGESHGVDITVETVTRAEFGWKAVVRGEGFQVELAISSPAKHDIYNATGALAVAIAAGVDPKAAAEALGEYRSTAMRMEELRSKSGAVIFNDCYNAAPTSVISALRTLSEYPASGRRIAFLGDMRELGEFTKTLHDDVARAASELGIVAVFPVGDVMPKAFPNSRPAFGSADDAAAFVLEKIDIIEGDVILVKGSRAIELEKITRVLINK